VVLGGSAIGFFLSAAQTYMELSEVLMQVERRFGLASMAARDFGDDLGYTIAQTGSLMELMGAQVGKFQPGGANFQRYLGFATYFKHDPRAMVGGAARMSRLMGGLLGEADLAALEGQARLTGQGRGLFEEYMQVLGALTEAEFMATGRAEIGGVQGLAGLPGLVFGRGDPRALGMTGMATIQGLNQAMRTPQMESFLMRAMGYGKAGGLSYVQMRKRTQAGIYGRLGAENIADVFQTFIDVGMEPEAMMLALEEASGGALQMWQIEGLVGKLGKQKGLDEFKAMYGVGQRQAWVERGFSLAETAKDLGWAEAGREGVSLGAAAKVQMEGLRMAVGAPVAQSIIVGREALSEFGSMLAKVLGEDWGDVLVGAVEAIRDMTAALNNIMPDDERGGIIGRMREGGDVAAESIALWRMYGLGAGTFHYARESQMPLVSSMYRSGPMTRAGAAFGVYDPAWADLMAGSRE
jgi:hypothetical protein